MAACNVLETRASSDVFGDCYSWQSKLNGTLNPVTVAQQLAAFGSSGDSGSFADSNAARNLQYLSRLLNLQQSFTAVTDLTRKQVVADVDALLGFASSASNEMQVSAPSQDVAECWKWLALAERCSQAHVRQTADYHQFYYDLHDVDRELRELHQPSLHADIDDTNVLACVMQLQETVTSRISLWMRIEQLISRSRTIRDVRLLLDNRRLASAGPISAQMLCSFRSQDLKLEAGDQVQLIELNSGADLVKVKTSSGRVGLLPKLCCLVDALDVEAAENSLVCQKRLVALWEREQQRVMSASLAYFERTLADLDVGRLRSERVPNETERKAINSLISSLRIFLDSRAAPLEAVGRLRFRLAQLAQCETAVDQETLHKVQRLLDALKVYCTYLDAYRVQIRSYASSGSRSEHDLSGLTLLGCSGDQLRSIFQSVEQLAQLKIDGERDIRNLIGLVEQLKTRRAHAQTRSHSAVRVTSSKNAAAAADDQNSYGTSVMIDQHTGTLYRQSSKRQRSKSLEKPRKENGAAGWTVADIAVDEPVNLSLVLAGDLTDEGIASESSSHSLLQSVAQAPMTAALPYVKRKSRMHMQLEGSYSSRLAVSRFELSGSSVSSGTQALLTQAESPRSVSDADSTQDESVDLSRQPAVKLRSSRPAAVSAHWQSALPLCFSSDGQALAQARKRRTGVSTQTEIELKPALCNVKCQTEQVEDEDDDVDVKIKPGAHIQTLPPIDEEEEPTRSPQAVCTCSRDAATITDSLRRRHVATAMHSQIRVAATQTDGDLRPIKMLAFDADKLVHALVKADVQMLQATQPVRDEVQRVWASEVALVYADDQSDAVTIAPAKPKPKMQTQWMSLTPRLLMEIKSPQRVLLNEPAEVYEQFDEDVKEVITFGSEPPPPAAAAAAAKPAKLCSSSSDADLQTVARVKHVHMLPISLARIVKALERADNRPRSSQWDCLMPTVFTGAAEVRAQQRSRTAQDVLSANDSESEFEFADECKLNRGERLHAAAAHVEREREIQPEPEVLPRESSVGWCSVQARLLMMTQSARQVMLAVEEPINGDDRKEQYDWEFFSQGGQQDDIDEYDTPAPPEDEAKERLARGIHGERREELWEANETLVPSRRPILPKRSPGMSWCSVMPDIFSSDGEVLAQMRLRVREMSVQTVVAQVEVALVPQPRPLEWQHLPGLMHMEESEAKAFCEQAVQHEADLAEDVDLDDIDAVRLKRNERVHFKPPVNEQVTNSAAGRLHAKPSVTSEPLMLQLVTDDSVEQERHEAEPDLRVEMVRDWSSLPSRFLIAVKSAKSVMLADAEPWFGDDMKERYDWEHMYDEIKQLDTEDDQDDEFYESAEAKERAQQFNHRKRYEEPLEDYGVASAGAGAVRSQTYVTQEKPPKFFSNRPWASIDPDFFASDGKILAQLRKHEAHSFTQTDAIASIPSRKPSQESPPVIVPKSVTVERSASAISQVRDRAVQSEQGWSVLQAVIVLDENGRGSAEVLLPQKCDRMVQSTHHWLSLPPVIPLVDNAARPDHQWLSLPPVIPLVDNAARPDHQWLSLPPVIPLADDAARPRHQWLSLQAEILSPAEGKSTETCDLAVQYDAASNRTWLSLEATISASDDSEIKFKNALCNRAVQSEHEWSFLPARIELDDSAPAVCDQAVQHERQEDEEEDAETVNRARKSGRLREEHTAVATAKELAVQSQLVSSDDVCQTDAVDFESMMDSNAPGVLQYFSTRRDRLISIYKALKCGEQRAKKTKPFSCQYGLSLQDFVDDKIQTQPKDYGTKLSQMNGREVIGLTEDCGTQVDNSMETAGDLQIVTQSQCTQTGYWNSVTPTVFANDGRVMAAASSVRKVQVPQLWSSLSPCVYHADECVSFADDSVQTDAPEASATPVEPEKITVHQHHGLQSAPTVKHIQHWVSIMPVAYAADLLPAVESVDKGCQCLIAKSDSAVTQDSATVQQIDGTVQCGVPTRECTASPICLPPISREKSQEFTWNSLLAVVHVDDEQSLPVEETTMKKSSSHLHSAMSRTSSVVQSTQTEDVSTTSAAQQTEGERQSQTWRSLEPAIVASDGYPKAVCCRRTTSVSTMHSVELQSAETNTDADFRPAYSKGLLVDSAVQFVVESASVAAHAGRRMVDAASLTESQPPDAARPVLPQLQACAVQCSQEAREAAVATTPLKETHNQTAAVCASNDGSMQTEAEDVAAILDANKPILQKYFATHRDELQRIYKALNMEKAKKTKPFSCQFGLALQDFVDSKIQTQPKDFGTKLCQVNNAELVKDFDEQSTQTLEESSTTPAGTMTDSMMVCDMHVTADSPVESKKEVKPGSTQTEIEILDHRKRFLNPSDARHLKTKVSRKNAKCQTSFSPSPLSMLVQPTGMRDSASSPISDCFYITSDSVSEPFDDIVPVHVGERLQAAHPHEHPISYCDAACQCDLPGVDVATDTETPQTCDTSAEHDAVAFQDFINTHVASYVDRLKSEQRSKLLDGGNQMEPNSVDSSSLTEVPELRHMAANTDDSAFRKLLDDHAINYAQTKPMQDGCIQTDAPEKQNAASDADAQGFQDCLDSYAKKFVSKVFSERQAALHHECNQTEEMQVSHVSVFTDAPSDAQAKPMQDGCIQTDEQAEVNEIGVCTDAPEKQNSACDADAQGFQDCLDSYAKKFASKVFSERQAALHHECNQTEEMQVSHVSVFTDAPSVDHKAANTEDSEVPVRQTEDCASITDSAAFERYVEDRLKQLSVPKAAVEHREVQSDSDVKIATAESNAQTEAPALAVDRTTEPDLVLFDQYVSNVSQSQLAKLLAEKQARKQHTETQCDVSGAVSEVETLTDRSSSEHKQTDCDESLFNDYLLERANARAREMLASMKTSMHHIAVQSDSTQLSDASVKTDAANEVEAVKTQDDSTAPDQALFSAFLQAQLLAKSAARKDAAVATDQAPTTQSSEAQFDELIFQEFLMTSGRTAVRREVIRRASNSSNSSLQGHDSADPTSENFDQSVFEEYLLSLYSRVPEHKKAGIARRLDLCDAEVQVDENTDRFEDARKLADQLLEAERQKKPPTVQVGTQSEQQLRSAATQVGEPKRPSADACNQQDLSLETALSPELLKNAIRNDLNTAQKFVNECMRERGLTTSASTEPDASLSQMSLEDLRKAIAKNRVEVHKILTQIKLKEQNLAEQQTEIDLNLVLPLSLAELDRAIRADVKAAKRVIDQIKLEKRQLRDAGSETDSDLEPFSIDQLRKTIRRHKTDAQKVLAETLRNSTPTLIHDVPTQTESQWQSLAASLSADCHVMAQSATRAPVVKAAPGIEQMKSVHQSSGAVHLVQDVALSPVITPVDVANTMTDPASTLNGEVQTELEIRPEQKAAVTMTDASSTSNATVMTEEIDRSTRDIAVQAVSVPTVRSPSPLEVSVFEPVSNETQSGLLMPVHSRILHEQNLNSPKSANFIWPQLSPMPLDSPNKLGLANSSRCRPRSRPHISSTSSVEKPPSMLLTPVSSRIRNIGTQVEAEICESSMITDTHYRNVTSQTPLVQQVSQSQGTSWLNCDEIVQTDMETQTEKEALRVCDADADTVDAGRTTAHSKPVFDSVVDLQQRVDSVAEWTLQKPTEVTSSQEATTGSSIEKVSKVDSKTKLRLGKSLKFSRSEQNLLASVSAQSDFAVTNVADDGEASDYYRKVPNPSNDGCPMEVKVSLRKTKSKSLISIKQALNLETSAEMACLLLAAQNSDELLLADD